MSRRDLLRVGAVSLAASPLPGRVGAAEPAPNATARSVIYLWMGGGVTHIDSFDPKPQAPEEIRGTLTDQATAVPGIRFCQTLPCLARISNELAVIRSFSHDSNDHLLSQVYTLSGRKVSRTELFSEPNIGSIVSHQFGPRRGLPGYIAVPGITRPGPPPHHLFVGGWLGSEHAPFAVGGEPQQPDFSVTSIHIKNPAGTGVDEDLRPKTLDLPSEIDSARLDERAGLRQRLDALLRTTDRMAPLAAIDEHYRGAFELLLDPGVRKAFDLTTETNAVREAYGRTKLGGRCLLARRLVEAGARFVMVDYGYDPEYGNLWDNHAVPLQNQPHISQMCQRPYHLAGMDRAFAALISDLAQRGLLGTTLVVFLTEFGRTPRINQHGGRDHWGPAGSIFFAGGGTRGGQVIGRTDRQAAFPIDQGYSPADVAATIYTALGIDPASILHDQLGRPQFVLPAGRPIPGVLA